RSPARAATKTRLRAPSPRRTRRSPDPGSPPPTRPASARSIRADPWQRAARPRTSRPGAPPTAARTTSRSPRPPRRTAATRARPRTRPRIRWRRFPTWAPTTPRPTLAPRLPQVGRTGSDVEEPDELDQVGVEREPARVSRHVEAFALG